jgi:hypothetical protein
MMHTWAVKTEKANNRSKANFPTKGVRKNQSLAKKIKGGCAALSFFTSAFSCYHEIVLAFTRYLVRFLCHSYSTRYS